MYFVTYMATRYIVRNLSFFFHSNVFGAFQLALFVHSKYGSFVLSLLNCRSFHKPTLIFILKVLKEDADTICEFPCFL